MRDYVINEARSRQAYGRLTWVVRVIKNWHARKSLRHLQGFSDYQLNDIGLTRCDLIKFIALPLMSDVIWETERLSLIASKNQMNRQIGNVARNDVNSPWLQLSPSLANVDLRNHTKIQRGTLAA